MPISLAAYEKLAVSVATIALSVVIFVACTYLNVATTYSDFFVGNITWTANTKLQDLVVVPALIVTIFGAPFLLVSLLASRQTRAGFGDAASLAEQLIWWSLPALVLVFNLLIYTRPDPLVLGITVVGLGFICVSALFKHIPSTVGARQLGFAALAFILVSLFPLELALVLGRWDPVLVGVDVFPRYVYATYMAIVLSFGCGAGLAVINPRKLVSALPTFLLLGQVGASFYFLTLFPAKLSPPDAALTSYTTTIWFKLLIGVMVILGIVDTLRRYISHSAGKDIVRLLSPVSMFALLVGLKLGNTVAPFVNPDDYHFGEGLLGWWSYLQGTVPFVGYIPAHGLIDDDMVGFICKIFYDGSAGSMADAARLAYALVGLAAFISIYAFTGSIGMAFVSGFFLGGRLVWFFLTPFLCLWCSSTLREKPEYWLCFWVLSIPVVLLGTPPQGLLLIAASSPLAAFSLWRLWKDQQRLNWKPIAITLIVLFSLLILTPAPAMLIGAIHYVLENGPINQPAYGVAWTRSWTSGAPAGLLFELVRMSWIVVPLICAALIHFHLRKRNEPNISSLIPAVVIILFMLLLIPYSMGRIDPGNVSRPGLVAIFGWTVLLPIALWKLITPRQKTVLILLVACVGAALGFVNISAHGFIAASVATVPTGPLRDGAGAGLAHIGKAYVQEEHWSRLANLNLLLNKYLAPRQPYLDLTSRNAQYFYLDRKPVIDVTAPYNMVAPSQQKRAVEILSANPPKIALLDGANIIHDGGGLALRTPYLYRFVVDNYVPRLENGFIVGHHERNQNNARDAGSEATIGVSLKNVNDQNWIQGIHRREPALILEDSALLSVLNPGDALTIGEFGPRAVTRVWAEGSAIWFGGAPFDASMDDMESSPGAGMIQLSVSPQLLAEYRAALFQKAFSQSELGEIPVAWGRSEKSLRHKMRKVRDLSALTPALHQFQQEGGALKVDGTDPGLTIDLADLHLSGRDAGLLRFDFLCQGGFELPRLQVFWWGDQRSSPQEASSVKFTAANGALIVPLDASARWLTLTHLKGLRIDLDNANTCVAVEIKNIGLFQRVE